MARCHDIFVSYATEDFAHTTDLPRTDSLRFYVDPPDKRPPSRVRDVVWNSLQATWRRWRGDGFTAQRTREKSADEIRAGLERRMDHADSLLVLWSQSHRGSPWASYEVSYFENRHPHRPILCLALDHTPRPSKWHLVDAASDLLRIPIAEWESRQAAPATPSRPSSVVTLAEALGRPAAWSARARRWSAGTTIPELIRLKRKVMISDDREQKAFLASARKLAFAMCLAAGVALLAAVCFLLWLRSDEVFARHAALAAALAWMCLLMVGVQASLVSVLPAALAATIVGTVVEVALVSFTKYRDGGAAGASALGTFIGVVATYERRLVAPRGGRAFALLAAWKWAMKNALVGVLIALGLAFAVIILIAPSKGHLGGPLLVVLAILLAVVPFAALWAEVSRWGRLREFVKLGWRPACILASIFLALGASIWLANPSVNHGRLYSGFVAGAVAGTCVGCFYLGAGFLLGFKVTSDVRALASASAVTVGLGVLAAALPILSPANDLNHEVSIICVSYSVALAISAAGSHQFLKRGT